MLGAQGLWAGRGLYRATPTVTRDLGLYGLIRKTGTLIRKTGTLVPQWDSNPRRKDYQIIAPDALNTAPHRRQEDNEMKLGMIVYNNGIQIKFEFCCYWSKLESYGSLDLEIFENFCFPDISYIIYADIDMELDMIVYKNELQINFEFRRYWWIFDRLMAPGLRIFLKISQFPDFADIEICMTVNNNELQIRFEFCYWSIFDRVMTLGLKSYLWGQACCGDILFPFRGRHLVPTCVSRLIIIWCLSRFIIPFILLLITIYLLPLGKCHAWG
jgi:hypothetical protein